MRDRTSLYAFGLTLTAITVASLMPATSGSGAATSPAVTNLLHVPAYGLLAATACRALAPLRSRPHYQLLAVLGLITLAGGMIEVLQPLVGRDASLGDMLLNLVGAGLAWTAYVGGTRVQVHRV